MAAPPPEPPEVAWPDLGLDDWVELEAPEARAPEGRADDGPFPVEVDARGSAAGPSLHAALTAAALEEVGPRGRLPATGIRGDLEAMRVGALRLERRRPAPRPEPALERRPAPLPRVYPRMRALLAHPERVPGGSDPLPEPLPPPVPGTFIPSPPPAPPRPEPARLDELLAQMAEGLLVGAGAGGVTEVRITLKDAFFAGTELRIGLDGRRVAAVLRPPSREVHRQLGAEAHRLRARLEGRGLRVDEVVVEEPPA